MLEKTRGIVLKYIKFKEKSIIVYIYTEKFGFHAFIVNQVFSEKRNTISIFQPLNLLNLVIYYKRNGNLQRIKEVGLQRIYHSIPHNKNKIFLVFFLQEILIYILREEKITNSELFDFLTQKINDLENNIQYISNFHIIFLIELSKYLGFDLKYEKNIINYFLKDNIDIKNSISLEEKKMTLNKRKAVLKKIIQEYQLHYDALRHLKSLEIIQLLSK